ncbi:MAG: TIR domain-containing protein [Acidobacteriota bacterium]
MRYRAFISYASADRGIGERFQRAIEHYRIPRPLRGVDRGFGPVPKRLTPLFRDRSDAEAGGSLDAALAVAIERSEAMVLLCSPASARSEWVNKEIRRFKALGRSGRIFPVLVDGAPIRFDGERAPHGAFPPALFQRVDDSGRVIAEDDPEPLAADVRAAGDGFELAKLKVVAGLTGVGLTELTQRQLEAERRDRTIVRRIAGVMTALAAAAVIAAVLAYRSAEAARTRLSNAIEMAARRVDDGARFGDEYGVPSEVIHQLLNGAERDFATLIGREETGVPVLELQRGRLLVLFSRLYRAIGDSAQQLARARDGLATLERVPTARQLLRPSTWLATLPSARDLTGERLGALEALALAVAETNGSDGDVTAMLERGRDLASRSERPDYVARFWSRLGERQYDRGDIVKARAAQDAAIAALDSYLTGASVGLSAEQASALSDRAELLLESERHQEALADQARVVAAFEAQSSATPNDANALQSLGHALSRHADMQYAVTGSWSASVAGFERALELFERAHASDQARVDYARDVSIGLERLGDVMLQTGDLKRARTLFDRSIDGRRDRFKRDPGNSEAARDLAVGLERQGDLALAESRADRALSLFGEARTLRSGHGGELPAASDPVLVRDLAVLWYKTGSARARVSMTQPWREAYDRAIRLMVPLIARENAPPGWLRDVAVFRFAYGEALSRDGRTAAARDQWTAALSLIDTQIAINPDDPRLRGDRAALLARLGRRVRKTGKAEPER